MTDPTTILREAITVPLGRYDLGRLDDPSLKTSDITDDVLATRIPQACQTCKGSGVSTEPTTAQHLTLESCPDCPTIGTLLLYGWNVAVAVPHLVRSRFDDATDLLAVLREVPT